MQFDKSYNSPILNRLKLSKKLLKYVYLNISNGLKLNFKLMVCKVFFFNWLAVIVIIVVVVVVISCCWRDVGIDSSEVMWQMSGQSGMTYTRCWQWVHKNEMNWSENRLVQCIIVFDVMPVTVCYATTLTAALFRWPTSINQSATDR